MIWKTDNNLTYAAVVPAAGLSSRMGAFKPLLDLNGKPLICRTLDSLWAGGAETICVVTGHRAEELEAAAAAPDVRFVRNPDYAQNGMLESVQIGLKALFGKGRQTAAEHPFDFVFILPGDIPLVSPETMQALTSAAEGGADLSGRGTAAVVRPSFQGRAGHPVLLNSVMAEDLLQYKGPDGLRGFLKGHLAETVFVETDDPAILADADTPEDYQKVLELKKKRGF